MRAPLKNSPIEAMYQEAIKDRAVLTVCEQRPSTQGKKALPSHPGTADQRKHKSSLDLTKEGKSPNLPQTAARPVQDSP